MKQVTAIFFSALLMPVIAFAYDFGGSFMSDLIATIVYSLVGMMLIAVGFFVIDAITPGHLGKAIKEEQNMAAAVVVAASILSIAIIIASVMLS